MHGCGSGRRLSSLRMLVSSCRRISRFSAASLSRDRFPEVLHVDCGDDDVSPSVAQHGYGSARRHGTERLGRTSHEQVAIFLLEAMQSFGRILCLVFAGAPGGEGA